MPRRRMKGYYPAGVHAGEHNETLDCRLGTPCEPVADTVTVPATGTVLVVDGRVIPEEEVKSQRRTKFDSGGVGYTFLLKPPKPTFFEEGKTYRRVGVAKTFTVTHVDTHPVTGIPYAHGWIREAYPSGMDHTWSGSLANRAGGEEVPT
ncbi:hypothetical protein [Streptomyces sp. R44]|uniref:Uncharacterized protein n=1 Tax=Streptomyces sp. R44 TaxID=3238633 RepID=A0AB39TAQ9_9ACTN